MKKRNIIILVIMLVIGFASVTTNLFIQGTTKVGYDEANFSSSVVYTRAETEDGTAVIDQNGKNIQFDSNKLENVNQTATLTFDVTNKSREYDANVTINCGLETGFESFDEFLTITTDITSPFDLIAGGTKTGILTVKLKKAYDKSLEATANIVCTLVATPVERDTLGNEYVPPVYVDATLNGADPVLKEKLIPITLADDGTVTYADVVQEWYNYENKRWANAVILNEGVTHEVGEVILESEIESYFVWIPRYKYQIFDEGNYTSVIDSKPITSIAKEIQIEFESKDTEPSAGTTKGTWLTHPAFTNFDVNGLWVGKFETGYKGATTKEDAQKYVSNSSKVIIKPNTYSWRDNTVSNMFKTAYNYNRDLDSHMMKNTEWGAAAYLSHSKYGINTEVRMNNNSVHLTGYAAVDGIDQSSYPWVYGIDSSKTLAYNTTTGYKASTTGNITGIYDMSGGAWEYVAAYMPSSNDVSGLTAAEKNTYAKYLDVYPSDSSVNSYNNRILGDATGEMGPFYSYRDNTGSLGYHSSWYEDISHFVDSTRPWFVRGGGRGIIGIVANLFDYTDRSGKYDEYCGSRLVLTPKI